MSMDRIISLNPIFSELSYPSFVHGLAFPLFFKKYFMLFGCTGSQVGYMGSLVAACGIQFTNQGLNPGPLHWECRVLATGPPGKSLTQDFFSPQTINDWGSWLHLRCPWGQSRKNRTVGSTWFNTDPSSAMDLPCHITSLDLSFPICTMGAMTGPANVVLSPVERWYRTFLFL